MDLENKTKECSSMQQESIQPNRWNDLRKKAMLKYFNFKYITKRKEENIHKIIDVMFIYTYETK